MELPGVGKPPGSSGASAVPEIRGSRHLVPVRDKARQERDGEDSNEIGNGKHGGGGGSRQRGGIAVLWRKGIHVVLQNYSQNHINVHVVEDDGFRWRFTGVYGESKEERKYITWGRLRQLNNLEPQSVPWLCAGDFNEILFRNEKEGGNERPQRCMDKFREALEECDLHDLGFSGDRFTWRNKQMKRNTHIRERLDRAVANYTWRDRFSLVKVRNGDPYHSDHRPVVIVTCDDRGRRIRGAAGEKAFHFEAAWLKEERCRGLVEEAWEEGAFNGEGNVAARIMVISSSLQHWNNNVLRDLEKRLQKAKKELEVWRRKTITDESVHMEAVLNYKVDRLEEQLDTYWR
jgi:hypothetical protein